MACEDTLMVNEDMLCTKCMYHLPFTDFHLDPNNETAKQLWGKIQFEQAFSMLHLAKSSRVETLLHKLKYKNHPEIGLFLGNLYAAKLSTLNTHWDYVVPIPIHKDKLRKRGYNQAAEFARGLSAALNVEMNEDILIREISSVSQIQKSRTERYDNVKGVFLLIQKLTLN
ncbi:ComF family protein [Sphingobacterium sp. WQ 366]|uniref:ComF family protein n=2 Tax=Sphingobacterium bovistauri TaxID=2781959 RepID=A0ABS7Z6V8_9SPHI|nr:ComF family protein [Sphingobacterium bovistauri]